MASVGQSSDNLPIPAAADPVVSSAMQQSSSTESSPSSSASSVVDETSKATPQRRKLGDVIPRETPHVELTEEEYDENDARTMSPRRNSEDVEKMGQEARQALMEQAKTLQAGLLAIVEQVEVVKESHVKLEQGNEFLQSYIGELITSSGAAKAKSGRSK